MSNEIISRSPNLSVREISVITSEIKELCRQAKTMALVYAVEIGRRLVEAKQTLPYGSWGEWLKNEVEFSQSSANNFMKLFEEYGSAQISVFGACVDSQSFANLPYSKALQLLAIPKEEREAFAEEVKAEELSVKELKAAIEERDTALREAREAKEREEELADKLAEAESAAADVAAKDEELRKLKEQLDTVTTSLERSKKNAATLKEKLKKAEENPQISEDQLKRIKSEAAEAAQKEAEASTSKTLEEIQKKLACAEEAKRSAELVAKQAQASLEETQRKLKTASPEVTTFKALFDSMQDIANKLKASISNIRKEDPDTANKLTAALKAFGASL